MHSRRIAVLALGAAVLIGAAATAHATVVVADTQGWITQAGAANGGFPGNNYIVGNCGAGDCNVGEYRDFFGFALPGSAGSATSAVLTINTHLVFDFQSPGVTVQFTSSAAPSTFGLLGTGTVYATHTYFGSDTGSTVMLTLNAAALADIHAVSGGEFYISGRVISPTVFDANAPDQFAYGGSFTSATLTLESGTAIPEPVSLALLGAGIAGLGAFRWGRKRAA